MRRITESSAGVSFDAILFAIAAFSLISVSAGAVDADPDEGVRVCVGVVLDVVTAGCCVGAVAPKLGSQLDPEDGPTIEGMDGDGMANSLGEVLGAVPVDCEFPDATDADDWTT